MAPNDVMRHPKADGARLGSLRLLLADDNPSVISRVCAILGESFDIVAVCDGETVLSRYLDLEPDVIVLDISMGRMSGLDVARVLREKGCGTPIVFLTVHRGADFVSAALSSGGSGYVLKSEMNNDLPRAIHAAISGDLFVSSPAG
jgi:DNA-binding NarL/FixJ family response regulator